MPRARSTFRVTVLVLLAIALHATAAETSPYVLMCLAAHPDDEDGATLAYFHGKYGIKTYSVFFTRGDGGQNEIGPELYKDLAVIRTRETQEASHVVGSEAFFLNFPDFGYSKSATETYAMWHGRDEVLRRLVYMIRVIRPDVIITNHHPAPDYGENHGNHQVVAIAALDAMQAAADSTYHPEQFKGGVRPWQVHKLYMRVWDYHDSLLAGGLNQPGYSSLPDVAVPVGELDVHTGKRFQELANEALRAHRTQGMEYFQAPVRSDAHVWYKQVQADANYPASAENMFRQVPARTDRAPELKGVIPAEFISMAYLDSVLPQRFPPPHVTVRQGLRVGVVRSYDNTIVDALGELRVPYTLLDSNALHDGNLSTYATILIDIRAYSKRPDLVAANRRLLDYVVNGGNLVVFYQKTMEWKPEYAPFPLQLTRNRITDENSPLATLAPRDPVFTSPNVIADGDWKDWIVERGLYFPARSANYSELLVMTDPGEDPQFTGLLRARYGTGSYWYCALSLYRQLRQRHEGAFKLFGNLISYQPE